MSSPPELAAASAPNECAETAPRTPAAAQRTNVWLTWLAPCALVALVTALYLPSVTNEFIFDDHVLILQERRPESVVEVLKVFSVRHWPNLPYYRPVARVTMAAQKMLYGDYAPPYHAFNALVMGLVSAAAWLLLKTPVFGIRAPLAWVAALLVGVHPIASSCVYPICSGRETSLPALFMLLATSAWLRSGLRWRFVALLALAAALLSKEQAIVLPAIMLVADLLRLHERESKTDPLWWFRRYTPVVAMVALYLVLRLLLFGGGAEHKLAVFDTPYAPLLTAMYATQTTFLPFVPLYYEPSPQVWFSWWRQAVSWSLVLVIAFALWRTWPRLRAAALFWLAWIVLVNLPTANILDQEANFDERYELLSMVGVVGMIAGLLSLAWERRGVRLATTALATISIVAAAAVSYGRAEFFRDDFAFFRQWRAVDPEFDFVGMHLQVAGLDMLRDHYVEAEAHARAALDVASDSIDPRVRWRVVGPARTAIENAPDSMAARLALANALFGQSRLDEAQAQYDLVLASQWEQPEALAGTARILAARGNWEAAATRYRAALRQQPVTAETARQFAWLLATCPDEQVRNGSEAVRWATIVYNADRQRDVSVLDTLAVAYAEAGDFLQAAEWEEQALELAQPEEVDVLRRRLALFRSKQPYREGPAAASPQ